LILGSAAATWPIASKAQQAERVRRAGILNILATDDPEAHARKAVFEQTLEQLGWSVGRNLKIENRQVEGDLDSLRRYAAELVALTPDVLLSIGGLTLGPLQQATRTISIVFVNVPDPVGAGFVESMAHPGGNITGFSNFEYSMSGKWAELQANRAEGNAGLSVSRSHLCGRHRTIRGYPIGSAVPWY
jgi:putative ABC transport system substrate-binding protein